MAKTHIQKGIQVATAIAVIGGLVLLMQGDARRLSGALTGQGSTVVEQSDATLHAAAALEEYQQASAGIAIIVGMLLILIGLMLHALLLIRISHDRPVTVHGPGREHETLERGARKQRAIEVFWIEESIRLPR